MISTERKAELRRQVATYKDKTRYLKSSGRKIELYSGLTMEERDFVTLVLAGLDKPDSPGRLREILG